ncbi:unnamed protein product [Arctogadus glacialis]
MDPDSIAQNPPPTSGIPHRVARPPAGWFSTWLVLHLAGWFSTWLVLHLAGSPPGWFSPWLVLPPAGWFSTRLAGSPPGWFSTRLAGSPPGWLVLGCPLPVPSLRSPSPRRRASGAEDDDAAVRRGSASGTHPGGDNVAPPYVRVQVTLTGAATGARGQALKYK